MDRDLGTSQQCPTRTVLTRWPSSSPVRVHTPPHLPKAWRRHARPGALDLDVAAHQQRCRASGDPLNGKTVRGAHTTHATAPHLVAAFERSLGVTLGQIADNEKSNEIPTVCDLLASFAPEHLAGAVVTADAMHTQTDTA